MPRSPTTRLLCADSTENTGRHWQRIKIDLKAGKSYPLQLTGFTTARKSVKTSVLLTALACAAAGLHSASAASVTFSSVTGTFDQGAPYNVGASINGNAQDGIGWGIFGGQTAPSQSAVYTASAPFSGNRLAVSIPQFFGGDHYANEFRVSYTTDAVPSAGGAWTELAPAIARAANGLTLTGLGANRYGVSGVANGATTNFVMMASGAFTNVTGVRLELFNSGVNIGASGNGNLVISELFVTTDNSINLALGAPVTSSAPTYPGQFASFLVDGNTFNQTHPADPPAQTGFSYTVDLQGIYDLNSLELVNRSGGCCPDRLSNYRVEVLSPAMATLWSGDIRTDGSNSGPDGIDTITAASGSGSFSGQYVRITNLSNNSYNPQIAEFRAFGAPIPEPSVTGTLLLAAWALALRRRRR
jgi:hypothetical protein